MDKKYKIIISVTTNNTDIPDWGLGKGVLATQEVIYPADVPDYSIASSINEIADDLIKNTITIKYEELKN